MKRQQALEPVPVRETRREGHAGSKPGGHKSPHRTISPRRSATFWLGVAIVVTVGLVGFLRNVGDDTWEARLITAVSAALLGLSAIVAVLLAMAERGRRQRESGDE